MFYTSEVAFSGKYILYTVRHQDGDTSIYQLNLSERHMKELTRIADGGATLSIRQDGETVYWSVPQGDRSEVGAGWHQVMEYDLSTGQITEKGQDPLFYATSAYPCSSGCYYGTGEGHGDVYYYDYATGDSVLISPEAVVPESQPEDTTAELNEDAFFALFHELDESSMRAYLDSHPEALTDGWGGIDINESSLTALGTDIRTKNGDQVLAVNARDGVLLIRVTLANDSRGVLAICKDTDQVRVCPAGPGDPGTDGGRDLRGKLRRTFHDGQRISGRAGHRKRRRPLRADDP